MTILVQQRATVSNRIEKVLEDANIKLASVASHVLGRSGRTMLQAMVDGITDPEKLAEMARAKLRNKIPQLRLAFEGRFEERHRFQMEELLDQSQFLDATVAEFALKIEERSQPFHDKVELLITIPGVDRITASSMVAEIGGDMNQFPTGPASRLLGGNLSRQQGKRRQAIQRQDTEGQPLAEAHTLPGGVGSVPHEEHLLGRSVSSHRSQARKTASYHRGRT